MIDEFEKQLTTIELIKPVNAFDLLTIEPFDPDQILIDTFDRGDKVAIIGSSKLRKSFFLLQFLFCLAAGIDFLAWKIKQARRIFHIQFEIQENHFHRRVRRMARALNIAPEDIGDRFQIVNARGLGINGTLGIEKIADMVTNYRPDIISFDPLYKVASGVENAAEDMKVTMNAFDELAERAKASILYTHHDAKGDSGNRDIRDRGAGSNVLGRDYDAGITLTPHVHEPDAAVVETLLRNYRPQEPFVALWTEDDDTGGYRFDFRQDIIPTKKTSSNKKTVDVTPLDLYLPIALDMLKDEPMPIATFKENFRTKTGLTYARFDAFKSWSISGSHPPLDTIEKRGRGMNKKLIGLPAHILKLRSEDLG